MTWTSADDVYEELGVRPIINCQGNRTALGGSSPSPEVLEAMEKDSGIAIKELRADGGMVANEFLMQFQSDILNVQVVRPKISETTALGAAYAAGLAVGYWSSVEELKRNWVEDKHWISGMDEARRCELYTSWKKAVTRSFDWISGN